MTLQDLLTDAVGQLDDVETALTGEGAISWSRGGRPFSVLAANGDSAEFGLDPPVAAAAARTPDVEPSPRGAGWVVFTPAELDDHAADRAVAWLASAHRRLGPRD
ncbi:MAG: hypothetical protein ACJ77U_06650 [Chloroflexota bacterium]|jgi:hypothetical protein